MRLLALLLLSLTAHAADSITVLPGLDHFWFTDTLGREFASTVVYTTDGNGHLIPIGSSGGGGGGTVTQGPANDGISPWHVINTAFSSDFDSWKAWADVNLSTRASETTLSAINTKLTTTANGLKVDGSSVTQPISGSVTVLNPAPTPSPTITVTGVVTVANPDPTPSPTITVQIAGPSPLPVHEVSPVPTQTVTGAVTANLGTLNGAALASNQVTQISSAAAIQTSVASIDSKTPASPATAGNQTTANTALADIQTSTATTATNTTGVSTAANQSTANTSLAAIQASTATTATNTTGVSTAANQSSQLTQETSTASSASIILANQTNGTQKTQVTSTVLTSDRTAVTGNITAACTDPNINACPANSTVQISSQGAMTVMAQHLGTWSAVVVFDNSNDGGTTWLPQPAVDIDASVLPRWTVFGGWSQTFAADRFVTNTSGAGLTRLRASAYTSGTVNVTLTAAAGAYYTVPIQTNAASNQVTVNSSTTQTTSLVTTAASATAVTVAAADSSVSRTYFNDSASICYIKQGSGASSSSYWIRLAPFTGWKDDSVKIYNGLVSAIWLTATGNMQVTSQ